MDLSSDQREKLEALKAVSGVQAEEMLVDILTQTQWDLDRAINLLLDESNIRDSEPLMRSQQRPREERTRRDTGSAGEGHWLWKLITVPFTITLRIAWNLLSFANKILSGGLLNPTPKTDNRSNANRFLLDFEDKYGRLHPEFFQGTYTQALEKAKREIRYFVVILHSPEHDDADSFCKDILCSEELCSFLTERGPVVWAGDIMHSEPFQVSQVLGVTAYPFMCLIAPHGSRMGVVERYEGLLSFRNLHNALTSQFDRLDLQLASIRAEREQRETARRIREMQDEAYLASLRADEEKQRKIQEAEEQKRKELREQRMKIEAKRFRKEQIMQNLPPEPDANSASITKISIKLPNGERLIRRFNISDKIQLLADYIEIQDLSPIAETEDFIIVNTYPRREIMNYQQTFEGAGLCPNAAVIVEEKY